MAKEIWVRQGSVLTGIPLNNVWVRQGSRLMPVVSIMQRKGTQWSTLLDYTPGKPTNLRKDTNSASGGQDSNSVTLTWNAPSSGYSPEQYRIIRRPDGARKSTPPDWEKVLDKNRDANYFDARTFKVSGLKENTGYIFTVQAINIPWKTDPDIQVRGEESEPIRVFTGQKELKDQGSSRHKVGTGDDAHWVDYYEFQPNRSDTYTSSRLWDTNKNRVAQGIYDNSEKESRNRYGCVEYSGIYNRLVDLHGSVEVRDINDVAKKVNIADEVNITSAKLQTIGRMNDGHGGTPTLRLHNGYFSIGTDVTPMISGTKDVTAPREGQTLDHEVTVDKDWAQHWAKHSSSRRWNGLVLYRSDGNAKCVLAGASEDSMPQSWDLKLEYNWDITTRPQKNSTTLSYSWPV